MNKRKKPHGKFGGLYNHEVIQNLRAKLAEQGLIIAALIEHTGISELELKRISADFFMRQSEKVIRPS